MNPRWLNHFRGLAPIGVVGVALMAGCLLLKGDVRMITATWVYALICLVTGVSGFGLEMVYNTHLSMLTQPITRRALWSEKVIAMSCLFGALAFVYLSILLRWEPSCLSYPQEFHDTLILVAALAPLLALGGGSALTLLLRQVQGAFWLLAVFAATLLILIHSFWPKSLAAWQLTGALLIYGAFSIAGLAWGRRMFLNFQDYTALGSEVSFTWRAKESRSGSDANSSRSGGSAVLSLARKELGLQQINFILFVAILGLSALIRNTERYTGLAVMKDLVCIVGPFMIGAVAIAEERRIGVGAWHLTLPPSRLKQWLVKLTVCVGLSLALGVALREISRWLAPEWQRDGLLATVSALQHYSLAVFGSLLGLLASSAARHYFQALAILLVYVLVLSVLDEHAVWLIIPSIGGVPPANLFRFIGIPVLSIYVLIRAYRNFVSSESPGKLVARTLIGVLPCVVATFAATGFFYNRGWERFELNTSAHPVFKKEGAREFLNGMVLGVALDQKGRLWTVGSNFVDARAESLGMPVLTQVGSDSDWKQLVIAHGFGFGALKNDGTLWARSFPSQELWSKRYANSDLYVDLFPDELTMIAPEHRWAKIQRNEGRWLGLKEDGTLWIWGTNVLGILGLADPMLRWPEPRQVGTDNDWADIFPHYRGNLARKKNGTLWHWGVWTNLNPTNGPERGPLPVQITELASFNIVDARIGLTLLSKLDDGRILVGPTSPDADRWLAGLTIPLPEELKSDSAINLKLLKPEIDWNTIHYSGIREITYAITHGGEIVFVDRDSLRDGKGHSFRGLDYGGDWIAVGSSFGSWGQVDQANYLMRPFDRWEIGLKKDGSVWEWRDPLDFRYFGDHRVAEENLGAEKRRLLPWPFRPQRIGFLELDR